MLRALRFLLLLAASAHLAAAAPGPRVACIGDSITAGYGLPKGAPSYPRLLAQKLGPDATVGNFGASGRCVLKSGNAPYVRTKEWTAAQDFAPDVAVLLLGTNDSKPKNFVRIDEFTADATELIRALQALPSAPRIHLGLPPPVFKEIFGINEPNLDRIRASLRALAEREKLPVIDLSAALADHSARFPDGVHPDAEGVALIADAVFAAITAP